MSVSYSHSIKKNFISLHKPSCCSCSFGHSISYSYNALFTLLFPKVIKLIVNFCIVLSLTLICSLVDLVGASTNLPPGYFNRQFNDLLRTNYPNLWGNWNLSPHIKLGAIGIIDERTGVFRYSGVDIGAFEITRYTLPTKSMILTKGKVEQSGLDISADIYIDEANNSQLSLSWAFEERGSLISQWSLTGRQMIRKPVDTIRQAMDSLKSVAYNNNMLVDNGIVQGFGVITGVLLADSGMSLGSEVDNSSFEISGDSAFLKALTGQGGLSSGAHYYQTRVNGQVTSYIWPADPSDITDEVVIAYAFTSIDGEKIIPNWMVRIPFFNIKINNHGNYYINVTLDYECSETGKTHKTATVTAFSATTIGEIPIDATNIDLVLNYLTIFNNDETEKRFFWKSPLGSWYSGNQTINVSGIWPQSVTFETN